MRAEAQSFIDQINAATALLRRFLDWDVAHQRLDELNGKVEDPTLWDNPKAAQEVMRERRRLEQAVDATRSIERELADTSELIAMAEAGQAVVATPFTLAGAMTPVTLAAAIAQQNAEALFCVALTQIVRPGAPVVYGAFTSNVDMRTGSPAFGTPEYVKGAIASGQMIPRSSWFCSMAAAGSRVMPIP